MEVVKSVGNLVHPSVKRLQSECHLLALKGKIAHLSNFVKLATSTWQAHFEWSPAFLRGWYEITIIGIYGWRESSLH